MSFILTFLTNDTIAVNEVLESISGFICWEKRSPGFSLWLLPLPRVSGVLYSPGIWLGYTQARQVKKMLSISWMFSKLVPKKLLQEVEVRTGCSRTQRRDIKVWGTAFSPWQQDSVIVHLSPTSKNAFRVHALLDPCPAKSYIPSSFDLLLLYNMCTSGHQSGEGIDSRKKEGGAVGRMGAFMNRSPSSVKGSWENILKCLITSMK